jgi:hypothetical protein
VHAHRLDGVRCRVIRIRRPRAPCHHGVMRSRPASPLVSLGASLVMVASLAACDGQDPGGDEERTAESTAATSTPTVPPTPSEELGLAEVEHNPRNKRMRARGPRAGVRLSGGPVGGPI